MILDRQNTVSNAQAVTATAVSTDTIDLGVARDVGAGEDLRFGINIDQSFNNLTTLEIQVISASTADLVTGQTVLASTGAIALAQLTAGRRPLELELPKSNILNLPLGQRFLGLRYVVAGTAPTTGQVTSYIQKDFIQDIGRHYPVGYTVV